MLVSTCTGCLCPGLTGYVIERLAPRHVAMNWAGRLQRVLGIEIDTRHRCGEAPGIAASVEQTEVIAQTPALSAARRRGRGSRR